MLEGFKITGNKGFHITFENGWTVSVQIGGGNYCDNYDFPIGKEPEMRSMRSLNAEVAYWGPDKELQVFKDGDTVAKRWTPAQVLALMNDISKR